MADFRQVDLVERDYRSSSASLQNPDARKVASAILSGESSVSLGEGSGLAIIPSERNSALSTETTQTELRPQARREDTQKIDHQKENPFLAYFSQFGTDREQLKKEYYRLARQLHPDTNTDADATKKMQSLNEAYERITDQLDISEGKAKSTSTTLEGFSPTKDGILSESNKVASIFSELGYPTDQLPPITEKSLALLEQQSKELALGMDEATYPPEQGKDAVDQEGKPDWRKVAVWFAIVSVDLMWNHGRGMEHMLHEFLRSDAMPALFKWMGVEDTEILDGFLSSPGDMSKALLHLSETQLYHLLEQFSGNQVYDLLAGLSDQERDEFITQGKYGHHTIPEEMRHHLIERLSERQKTTLKLSSAEASSH